MLIAFGVALSQDLEARLKAGMSSLSVEVDLHAFPDGDVDVSQIPADRGVSVVSVRERMSGRPVDHRTRDEAANLLFDVVQRVRRTERSTFMGSCCGQNRHEMYANPRPGEFVVPWSACLMRSSGARVGRED